MTPREVDELRADEYAAMIDYAVNEQRQQRRAERAARRRGR
jgi:hypothetical protein